jgi:putative acetyltransferase
MQMVPFTENDAEVVSDIICDALDNNQYDFHDVDPKLIEHDKKIYSPAYIKEIAGKASFYLAVEDGEALAVAAIEGNELKVCYTRGKCQGQGIGRRLMEHIEAQARKQGITTLTVACNFFAEPFYAACGFQTIKKTTVDFHGAQWPVVHMEKELLF